MRAWLQNAGAQAQRDNDRACENSLAFVELQAMHLLGQVHEASQGEGEAEAATEEEESQDAYLVAEDELPPESKNHEEEADKADNKAKAESAKSK